MTTLKMLEELPPYMEGIAKHLQQIIYLIQIQTARN